MRYRGAHLSRPNIVTFSSHRNIDQSLTHRRRPVEETYRAARAAAALEALWRRLPLNRRRRNAGKACIRRLIAAC